MDGAESKAQGTVEQFRQALAADPRGKVIARNASDAQLAELAQQAQVMGKFDIGNINAQGGTALVGNNNTVNSLTNFVLSRIKQTAVQHASPPTRGFQGRDQELSRLAVLLGSSNTVSITGLAGIGKSGLAARYYEAQRDRSPYRCWRDLRRDKSIAGLAAALAARVALSFDPDEITNPDNQAAWVVQTIYDLNSNTPADINFLLVFDNLDTVLGDDGVPQEPGWGTLLTYANDLGDHCRLLLTSRVIPHDAQGRQLPNLYRIQGLDAPASRKLLLGYVPAADPDLLDKAAQQSSGHPQALMSLGNLAASFPLDFLLAQEQLWRSELLDLLWGKLAADKQEMLKYISLFEQPVSPADVAGTLACYDQIGRGEGTGGKAAPRAGWDEYTITRLALNLSRLSLLDLSGGRCNISMIVRDYASALVADQDAYHRAATIWFERKYSRSPHQNPPTDRAAVQPLLDSFYHLCCATNYAAADHLLHSRPLAYTNEQPLTLAVLLAQWQEYAALVALAEQLAGCNSDLLLRARALTTLGTAHAGLGGYSEALSYYRQAYVIYKDAGDDDLLTALSRLALTVEKRRYRTYTLPRDTP